MFSCVSHVFPMPFPVPLATYWGFPRIQRQVPALTEASEDRMASFWRNGYLVFPGLLADEAVGFPTGVAGVSLVGGGWGKFLGKNTRVVLGFF